VSRLADVPAGSPALVIEQGGQRDAGEGPEAFALRTESREGHAVVVAAGEGDCGRKRAVQRMVLASRQTPDALVFPSLDVTSHPWIPCREWTICPWTPQDVRGNFYNPFADKRMNLLLYSDERLARYVEMFDWFGFSGSQLMETCYTYSQFGSVEAAQDWQKRVIRCLRENGQDVTLWAWTAAFSGFGWQEPDAVYTPQPGVKAIDDPAVRRVFEKYYRRYAELAPLVDRFVAHFYDPGGLSEQSDVFDYMRLLESMLTERNPRIQMAVDCWAAGPKYFADLAQNGFSHYLLLPVSFPEAYPGDTREQIHRTASELGLHLGIWGWYTPEYETDQLASLYVNASVLREVYSGIRACARTHPIEYWSEMEAHHLNNVYSMYVAAQLLWDPDRDPHEALAEFTDAVWGPQNGPAVLAALRLIEDVRSGPSWDTYWWTRPGHRVGTDNAADDLKRAEDSLETLRPMQDDAAYVCKLPLPYPRGTFIELMLPHLEQIRHFAQFRLGIEAVRQAAARGVSKDELAAMLTRAWQPVPEFTTWVGVFGNQELRAQKAAVAQVASELGLTVPEPAALRYVEADRLLQLLRRQQEGSAEPIAFGPTTAGDFYWPEALLRDRFQKLVGDRLVVETSPGQYHLADWANWARGK